MIGIGASALISIRLGQGNKRRAEEVLGNVVLLNLIIGALFTVISLSFLDPILYFFGASENTIGYAREFMQIILGGTIITHLYLGTERCAACFGLSTEGDAGDSDLCGTQYDPQSVVYLQVRVGHPGFCHGDGHLPVCGTDDRR